MIRPGGTEAVLPDPVRLAFTCAVEPGIEAVGIKEN